MIKYIVNCELLEIKSHPSNKSQKVGFYKKGEIIETGGEPFKFDNNDDNNLWICYIDIDRDKDLLRYMCYEDKNEQKNFIKYDSPSNIKIIYNPSNISEINNDFIFSKDFGLKLSINENNSINLEIFPFNSHNKSQNIINDNNMEFIILKNNILLNNVYSINKEYKEMLIIEQIQSISNSNNKNKKNYYKQ